MGVESWLDTAEREARERGDWFVPGERKVTELQDWFGEAGRFEWRLNRPDVVLFESPYVLGWDRPLCFVFASRRHQRRVAVELMPKGIERATNDRRMDYQVLAGGDVDKIVRFLGKDIVYSGKDCACLFARATHWLYSDEGFEYARAEANKGRGSPYSREIDPNGVTYARVPWEDPETGEEAGRWVRMTVRTRHRPRLRRSAAA
jgi:hypothetical protein